MCVFLFYPFTECFSQLDEYTYGTAVLIDTYGISVEESRYGMERVSDLNPIITRMSINKDSMEISGQILYPSGNQEGSMVNVVTARKVRRDWRRFVARINLFTQNRGLAELRGGDSFTFVIGVDEYLVFRVVRPCKESIIVLPVRFDELSKKEAWSGK